MIQDINPNFKQAYAHARDTVKADESLPNLDVSAIISFVCDMLKCEKGKHSSVVKEYAEKYGPVFLTYGKIIGHDFISSTLKEALEKADREEFHHLAESGFAECLVTSSEKVIGIVHSYFKKDITDQEFVVLLSKAGIGDVGTKVMDAFHINPSELQLDPKIILKFSAPIMAYQGLMGAYREYSKAMDDLNLARESRLRVEAECQKSIDMMRAYREEAERRVSEYMNEHLDAFQSGFAAMDQAILANDPDGYIAGNVQIQQMLGAEIQFTNQEEFDELMDSDEDFIF